MDSDIFEITVCETCSIEYPKDHFSECDLPGHLVTRQTYTGETSRMTRCVVVKYITSVSRGGMWLCPNHPVTSSRAKFSPSELKERAKMHSRERRSLRIEYYRAKELEYRKRRRNEIRAYSREYRWRKKLLSQPD